MLFRSGWSKEATRGKSDDAKALISWMSSQSRRAMLADIGVGTIDQALMSVTQNKFFALRHHALAEKVLIIDEVHEADPYMEELVEQLLRYRGAQSLPTILMSATLPLHTRLRYANAWRSGQGGPEALHADMPMECIPCITQVKDASIWQPATPIAAANPKTLHMARIDGVEQCLAKLSEASQGQMNSIWIRNAVDEANAAYDALVAAGHQPILLHSRFTRHDRARISDRIMQMFGPGRVDEIPALGEIVISTQVIEAGLDIDLDLMISDLAPMSGLLQRAGRRHRHMNKMRTPRALQEPLYINGPDPLQAEGSYWLEEHLGKGRFIYRDDVMWQTMRLVEENPEVSLPYDTRFLIEEATSQEGLPQWVMPAIDKYEREAQRARNIAQGGLIDGPETAYPDMSISTDVHSMASTRLGRPNITLTLLVERDGEVIPLYEDFEASSVSVGIHQLKMSFEDAARIAEDFRATWQINVPEDMFPVLLHDNGHARGGIIGERAAEYHADTGLRFL